MNFPLRIHAFSCCEMVAMNEHASSSALKWLQVASNWQVWWEKHEMESKKDFVFQSECNVSVMLTSFCSTVLAACILPPAADLADPQSSSVFEAAGLVCVADGVAASIQ